jgi:hypothetical protein
MSRLTNSQESYGELMSSQHEDAREKAVHFAWHGWLMRRSVGRS